jgi:SAM-dependent methyltransferase
MSSARPPLVRGAWNRLPAGVQRAVKRCLVGADSRTAPGTEQGPEFYDQTFHENPEWRAHYTTSMYYPVWTLIVDRVRRAGARSALEIGCGSGQLAAALHAAGVIERYCGLDFSRARLEQARRTVPAYRFELANAFTTDLYETATYDLVITTEFLEHVEKDLEVMGRIRPGSRVLATVPNFPYVSHVRHFASAAAVAERYGRFLAKCTVDPVPIKEGGRVLFLLEGERTSHSTEVRSS